MTCKLRRFLYWCVYVCKTASKSEIHNSKFNSEMGWESFRSKKTVTSCHVLLEILRNHLEWTIPLKQIWVNFGNFFHDSLCAQRFQTLGISLLEGTWASHIRWMKRSCQLLHELTESGLQRIMLKSSEVSYLMTSKGIPTLKCSVRNLNFFT